MACISKNPAFSEENELRIIHTPLIERDDSNFKMISNISNIKHRVSCNRLTSYFEYSFYQNNDTPSIKEIIMGPKCNTDMQDIKDVLLCNGFPNVVIKNSTASYR